MKAKKHRFFAFILSAFAMAAFISTTHAQIVSIQFSGTGTALSSTISAGVVSAVNWNSEAASSGSAITGLVDSSGATVSGLSLTYTSNGNVGGSGAGGDQGFQDLYSSHLESPYGVDTTSTGPIGDTNRVLISLSGITYSSYDIYVYTRNGDKGSNAYISPVNLFTTSASPNIGAQSTSISYTDTFASTYVNGDNYVVFTGLSGSQQFLFDSIDFGNNNNSGFAGVQIVSAVPEPSTYAMMLGGLGLLMVLRRFNVRKA